MICLQSAGVLHPKAVALSLVGEKVLGVAACNVRASVWTESGKVSGLSIEPSSCGGMDGN